MRFWDLPADLRRGVPTREMSAKMLEIYTTRAAQFVIARKAIKSILPALLGCRATYRLKWVKHFKFDGPGAEDRCWSDLRIICPIPFDPVDLRGRLRALGIQIDLINDMC